jgi:DNA-binding CsgD family transcriptional regulator
VSSIFVADVSSGSRCSWLCDRGGIDTESGGHGMTSPELYGRQAELATLARLVEGVAEHGAAVVVRGESGIGKSSLLRAAALQARRAGHLLLETTGIEAEAQLPFAGLHRLLRPVLGSAHLLPVAQRRALLTAFGIEDGPPPQLFLIGLGALNLLTEVATRQPVVAVIDDLQWLDGPTSEALAFLARRVAGDPIVIIGGLRTAHEATFSTAGLQVLDVHGLGERPARELLLAHATDLSDADRDLILRHALGNPLALVELPAAWRAARAHAPDLRAQFMPLSARLERAFGDRLSELPDRTRDAVLVAAVDDEDELPEILAAAAVLSGREVSAEILEPAAAVGLLRLSEMHLHFRHPLVRSGILQAESITRRQAANAALAEVLVHQPYRRTWHRAQAVVGLDDEIAEELEASHAESIRRGSITAAIAALERSARLTTASAKRNRRLLLAAEHAFGLGRADMVDRLVTAAEQTEPSELDVARVEWLREIFHDGVLGDADRVLQLCETARRSGKAGDTDLALNLLLGAALRCWWADTGPDARARVAAVTEGLDRVKDDPRYLAALAVAEPVRGSVVIRRLAEIGLETVVDADALRLLGMAAHAVGDQPRAADFLDRAEAKLRIQGRLGLLPHVLGMQCPVRLDLGDWERVRAAAAECLEVATETGQPIWSTGQLVNDARAAGLRGDSQRALELADEAEYAPTLRNLNNFRACAQLARGYAWITAGRHAEAYEALRRLFDPLDPSYHQREHFAGVMYLAEAAVHAGRRDDARKIITEMELVATITSSPLLHVHLLYARAVLADDEDAERLYLDGLDADLTRWPWVRARIQLAYGSWLRRQRRVTESREPLRAAQATCELIGARTWAEQARSELRAAGERAAARDHAAQDALSAQELQIARLAAEGLSNREIGQRLFLSHRTVGSHLYRIFPKLDITSRGQLAARLNAD